MSAVTGREEITPAGWRIVRLAGLGGALGRRVSMLGLNGMKPFAAAALAAFFIACSTQAEHAQAPAQPVQAEPAPPVIEHVSPKRDSVGGVPKRFEWTAVQGAESYQFELWTEYDTIVYRQRGIAATSTDFPSGETLDPGTYWWSVFAIRDGEPFASSGLAAFVVQD